ncbi:hypothetical protein QCA50_017035 [Cerrena zonata]|uniref:Nop domain-containing protein n=1 Tax=Cerrena zonata TaxID=2478898 RepID=A0AAW0FRA8_9APHY
MTDYENELLDDFESEDEQVEVQPEVEVHHDKLSSVLSDSNNGIISDRIGQYDTVQDITKISKIKPIIPELRTKIQEYSNDETVDYLELLSSVNQAHENDEYKFILQINELSNLINNEIAMIHNFIKINYKPVFSELETLVLNPVDYSKIVMLINQDLKNIKSYEDELKRITTNEKVLIIIMAGLQQSPKQVQLEDEVFLNVLKACSLVLELNEILVELSSFISVKLSKFCPNVSAIIGPLTTSQLLIATGSLRQLSLTPACNIPSLGVKDLSSTTKTNPGPIRATGYLYHCDLINFLPKEIMKQAMRIEIENKIDKLLTPPEMTNDKALPIPIESKSKKRGGRRFRKMKERFQMSDLRKAQNKMEFGKEEDSIINAMGEEVGLGMSKSGGQGRLNININANTNAKMSKSMINRLQKQKQSSANDTLDTFTLSNPETEPNTSINSLATLLSIAGNKWFTGMKRLQDEGNDTNKKPKF